MQIQRDDEYIRQAVFAPGEVGVRTVQYIDHLRKNPGVPSGLPDLDRVMVPLRPGELVVVCGATSNFKSRMMDLMALNAAKRIGVDEDRVVVKCTWEQSVEEDTLPRMAQRAGYSFSRLVHWNIGDPEWTALQTSANGLVETPMWLIGHSNLRQEDLYKARPALNMDDINYAMEYIERRATDRPIKIDMIVLDYLQRISRYGERGDTMREQFISVVDKAKDMAIRYGCPVLLGSQAKREVLERKIGLPMVGDGQETSNLEQSADKFISVWLPIKSTAIYPEGSLLKIGNEEFTVDPHLLILGLMKQKMGPAPEIFAYHVDYENYSVRGLNRF